MAVPSATDLHMKLDAFHEAISALDPKPTAEQLDRFAKFLAPQGRFYFGGMNLPPLTSRQQAIDGMKELLTYWKLKQRNVVTRAISLDGKVVIAEMDNELVIMGESLMFKEVEIATFDELGAVVEFKLYCDNNPVEEILKRKMK